MTSPKRSLPIAAALALALALPFTAPLPAAAQSLDETHHLVWHPSGKTPIAHYRPRGRTECAPTASHHAPHHQAGKTMIGARAECVAATQSRNAPALAQQGVGSNGAAE